MRTQQGPHTTGMTAADIQDECQKNLDDIVLRSLKLGINHFETAFMYGCSELMYGVTIKKAITKWGYRRSDLIIQDKLPLFTRMSPEDFRKGIDKCFARMDMTAEEEYFDLFTFHCLMYEDQLEWLTGGLMEVVEEYRARGKIRWVGFSTHAMTPAIVQLCDSGLFDFINVHYHFFGSFTSSGTGPHKELGGLRANWPVLEAAKRNDMGVFIISPTVSASLDIYISVVRQSQLCGFLYLLCAQDKGGQLYKPPKKLADACAPLSPIEFHNLWLLQHPEIHTLVVGAARASVSKITDHIHTCTISSSSFFAILDYR